MSQDKRKKLLRGGPDTQTSAVVCHMRLVLNDPRSASPAWVLSQFRKIMKATQE